MSTNRKNLTKKINKKSSIESHKIVKELEEGNNGRDESLSILGVEKYEVLALLSSSIVVMIAELFVAVEVTIRLDNQPNIHT